jgi:hypothetical protein
VEDVGINDDDPSLFIAFEATEDAIHVTLIVVHALPQVGLLVSWCLFLGRLRRRLFICYFDVLLLGIQLLLGLCWSLLDVFLGVVGLHDLYIVT